MNILNESNRIVDTKYMEEIFTDLQLKDNVNRNLQSLQKILNSSFDADCVDVILGDNNTDLYGMCVYPTESSLSDISKLIISGGDTKDMTKHIINSEISYIIEIDPKMLWDKMYNFKPAELVAILLHEIGHVTADSDFYNDLLVAYKTAIFNIEKDKAKLANYKYNKKDIEIGMMYIISAINSTQLTKIPNKDARLHKEQIADKFVVDSGYGDALVTAMDKFTKVYLNNYKDNNYDEKINLEAQSFVQIGNMFESRRKYVTDLIDIEVKRSPIQTVKSLLLNIQKSLKNVIFHEGVLFDKEILAEGFIDMFIKNPIKITQADIDDLRIQSEMMEDYDDKSILVYKIHKRISQLEQAREKCGTNDKYRTTIIDNYETQLEKLLQDIMKFKAVEKKYGVFIKYPKGYEG